MKSTIIKSIVLFLVFNLSFFKINAQIAINSDGSSPDASAMLDIVSSDKGVLVPRMSSTDRGNISNPATGLLVFDLTTNSFWYYTTEWKELITEVTTIADADNDTKIQVEANTDEDVIRLTSNGVETVTINEEQIVISSDLYVDFQGYASTSSLSVESPLDGSLFSILGDSDEGWQSFTAEDNGLLEKIEILLGPNTETAYEFKIYEEEGTSGQLLGSTTLSNPNASAFNSLDFSGQSIEIEKGKVYTLWFDSRLNVGFESGNFYAGGVASTNPNSYDFIFSLYLFKSEYGLSVVDGEVSIQGSVLETIIEEAAPVGTIQMWPTATPPTGWLICNGTGFDASTYPDLNTVLGGNTLPDFSGRFPLGAGTNGTNSNVSHILGDKDGTETHTLTIAEMPSHSHGITYQSRNKSGSGTSVADLSGSGNSATTDAVGGDEAHNNMPPYYTINFIIKAE